MFDISIDDLHQNQNEFENQSGSSLDKTKQQHFEKSVFSSHSTSDQKINERSSNESPLRSHNNKEKTTLSISKQLSSQRTKPQAKVTIMGTDRSTFASALTMAIRRHVSEIVIFDELYNRQMKISFYDLACALQLCPLSRSVNLIYTSDVAHTSRSDIILITEMYSNMSSMEENGKRSFFTLKEKAERFVDRLRGNPSIIVRLLMASPNAVFLIVRFCTRSSPYEYNALVVKSLAGHRCRAGQVCGLSANIYDHRLRYEISELLDISSKHITGFTLNNNTISIEPYWPSITVNGKVINVNEEHSSQMEERNINQSISNNAPQIEYESIRTNRIKKNETIIRYQHSTSVSSSLNIKKVSSRRPKKNASILHKNDITFIRIRQWLHSIKSRTTFKTNRAIAQKIEIDISNNATDATEAKVNVFPSIQDQLIKHLNMWHCLQLLHHRKYDYTLGMNLSQVTRAIISNSQEILILSANLESFLKRQSTSQIESEDNNLFASVPVLIRRYGIHAILNLKSQVDLYNHVRTALEHNRIFRDMMNYPLQKRQLIYDFNKLKTK